VYSLSSFLLPKKLFRICILLPFPKCLLVSKAISLQIRSTPKKDLRWSCKSKVILIDDLEKKVNKDERKVDNGNRENDLDERRKMSIVVMKKSSKASRELFKPLW